MPNLYRLSPGYAYRWDASEPETVMVPESVLSIEGNTEGYMPNARKGFYDGSRMIWIDTPEGTFGQMEHMAVDVRSERRKAGLCPTCGKVRLTARERARGYQCRDCTALDEGSF